ncbi:MAG: pyridoxal-phosphate dependent enzyme [Spirochaetia bacterium]
MKHKAKTDKIPDSIPDKADLKRAFERVSGVVRHTPLLSSQTFDRMTGGTLLFKCENFQTGGAFKFRGAVNAVSSLPDADARKGVATHSSGNHAQAVALAARMRGVTATIVMPETAPQVKVNAVRGYGADIRFCKATLAAREAALKQVVAETGASFIHPSNDVRVIAGQSTVFQELQQDTADLDMVLTPVGGGGLLSGTALAAKLLAESVKVIGCEPAQADDAYRSFKSGELVFPDHPDTIADGLKTALGSNTFPIVQKFVDDIVLVQEEEILQAMRLIWERMKIVVEPSAAVPLAALLNGSLDVSGARVGIILSGGNVDLDALPWYR